MFFKLIGSLDATAMQQSGSTLRTPRQAGERVGFQDNCRSNVYRLQLAATSFTLRSVCPALQMDCLRPGWVMPYTTCPENMEFRIRAHADWGDQELRAQRQILPAGLQPASSSATSFELVDTGSFFYE